MISCNSEIKQDYLKLLLDLYYPLHFFALFRAHELYNVEPFIDVLSPPILDLGCGDGLIANLLFGVSLDYGIDLSRTAIKRAQINRFYKTVFYGDAHAIPLEDNSLGGIFSNCVLEHIPDMPDLIREVARVLRSGHYFVATCLSPFYYTLNPAFGFFDKPLLGWFRKSMITQENKLHNHVSVFDIDEYRQMFESHGMVLEKHKYYAMESVTTICGKWDTFSKYIVPFPVGLRHAGFLVYYLKVRYRLFVQKDNVLQRWYNGLYQICYDRNEDNNKGVGQILVARKL